MQYLPRDVVLVIIRYMDIDSRRAMGVYTKLHVPTELQDRLGQCVQHLKRCITGHHSESSINVPLGVNVNNLPIYVLRREFGTSEKQMQAGESHYLLGRSWYNSSMIDHADYKTMNRMCPIQLECVEHRGNDNIIEYALIF